MMVRYHNAQVAGKNFAQDDLVLRNAWVTRVEQIKRKLSPKWEGPYVINEEIYSSTFRLSFEDS